jgi:structural maintenance of chromosome 4
MSSVVSTTEEESGVVAESQVEGQSHVREQSHIHARLPTASPHPSSMPGTPVAPQAGPVNDLPVAIVTETHARSREPTASPRPPTVPATPLGDITGKAVNERPAPVQTPHKVPDRQIPLSQTPMAIDIDAVVRKNAATLRSIREPVAPKNRLVITQLILTNFKSYAGQQVVGPFHPSFSSVVGPNGSGKSNVIDSLLFVFGFRASKMRQGKISALIHHSAAFPNLEYCEVEVHFQQVIDQPHGPPNVIPNSSLVVSRRAFKNNNSKYYIDGKESSFKVVTDVLKGYGVDLDHKRFLILQGEVESIAQM